MGLMEPEGELANVNVYMYVYMCVSHWPYFNKPHMTDCQVH